MILTLHSSPHVPSTPPARCGMSWYEPFLLYLTPPHHLATLTPPPSLQKQTPKTQLIAHDKEVYDICFATGQNIFGTVGGDGSVRMFDLRCSSPPPYHPFPARLLTEDRSLEHSTILYEAPDLSPLLRIAWNKLDTNYLATFQTCSNNAVILDIRYLALLPLHLCS
jgi:WD40 repeat protein